jgi:hypothetical protein
MYRLSEAEERREICLFFVPALYRRRSRHRFCGQGGFANQSKTSGRTREAKITKLNDAEEIEESWWCKLSEVSQSQFSE